MVKRKKRLEKGIISLENQKKLHELKRKQAEKLGQEELFRYYTKEIKSLEERKRNREGKLKRKQESFKHLKINKNPYNILFII